jgi:putative FmdB family regulatory protein
MPLYEYVCSDCGTEFDTLRPMRMSDAPIVCEHCGGEHTQRKLSVFFAQSEGQALAGGSAGCGSCAGGNCASCAN